jgi:arylsulfatase A-like enzyme
MKAIMLMFDSLNRLFLPPYGCDWIKAPNFQRLASKCVTFDKSYAASMPCIPARRELHTGRYNFLHRSWGPLEPFDDSMPEILKKNKVHTHLVTDHQHYWEDGGATYHNRYTTHEFIRGQEGDPWKGVVADTELPPFLGKMEKQDWVNRGYMKTDEGHAQTITLQKGLEFISTNHKDNRWFIQIECFDPHEPFFTHQRFKDLYPHCYEGPHFDWPAYRRVSETPEQVEHCRLEYAALLSKCDESLGKVLDMMDRLDLWKDTMLIVNTDHGFLLGEHEWWAKMVQPFYEEVVHTPLFIWDPRAPSRKSVRCDALVQTIDLAPTLLDYFGVTIPPDMQGKPLARTIAHNEPVRTMGLFGMHGGLLSITDGRYVYMRAPQEEKRDELYNYTLMPTHMRYRFQPSELKDVSLEKPFSFTKGCPVLKTKSQYKLPGGESFAQVETLLFDLQNDPQQKSPIINPEIENRLVKEMIKLMRWNDAPQEVYDRYGLVGA